MFICHYFFNCWKLHVIIIWLNPTLSWSRKCTSYLTNSKYKHKFNNYWFKFLPENFWITLLSGLLPNNTFTFADAVCFLPPCSRLKSRNIDYVQESQEVYCYFTDGAVIVNVSYEMTTWNKKSKTLV